MVRSKTLSARPRVFVLALVAAAFLTIAFTQSALAANVTGNSTGPYTLTAGAGEVNQISVTKYGTTYVQIADATSTLTESSTGCTKSGTVVRCYIGTSTNVGFTWNLGDQDDTITFASTVSLRNTIDGSDGNDNITGSVTADTISGGYGADIVTCGGGVDLMSYADHASGVNVYPDGNADDGEIDEFDNVGADCENIDGSIAGGNYLKASDSQGGVLQGGTGSDTLIASSGNTSTNCTSGSISALWGGSGDDLLVGKVAANYLGAGEGNDISIGGSGCDYIYDTGGSDTLTGNAGDDYVHDGYDYSGVPQNNVVIGGPGQDTVFASNKDDLVITADGEQDTYSCAGSDDETTGDQVVRDSNDQVGNYSYATDCEVDNSIPVSY